VPYFAAAVTCTEDGWVGAEVDLDEVEDLEALGDLLRDQLGDAEGPALLLFEEDDEHFALVRVDGGRRSLDEPRVFLSDRRAVQGSEVAAMLWELADPADADDDEDEGTKAVAEPVGEAGLLSDLGVSGSELLDLCAGRLLPADVLTTLCERAGCAEVLEELREGV
jgi:putative tRNA adenosine deaminase-associated protein